MRLTLQGVSKVVRGQMHLHGIDLDLASGSFNVLLGPTQAGKTSLLRLMAGLDRPTAGAILADGNDVTALGVRRRNVAMVYQEFMNYPNFTVYQNIAAPLQRAKRLSASRDRRQGQSNGGDDAHRPVLRRLPSELSGGQQQRVALARALVKEAPLLLLDEPLLNLDYKLREELRSELRQIFRHGKTTVVYATTEPQEALLFGGNTAMLDAGRVLQSGPALDVYRRPATVRAAEVFSDPPINLVRASIGPRECRLSPSVAFPVAPHMRALPPGDYRVGVRANHIGVAQRAGNGGVIRATVELAEINGSETYVHARHSDFTLIALLEGVHEFALGEEINLHLDPDRLFVFDGAGGLAAAAAQSGQSRGGALMARIEFKDIKHSYLSQPAGPEDYALQPMHLAWQDGGAYALLGPSGSGKTTLLNIISGLLRPSGGSVLFDGRDVTGLSPVERNIAQVFQFPVIYDTMTVFDNLAFPLRNRGIPEAEVRGRVAEVAEMLELGADLRRRAAGSRRTPSRRSRSAAGWSAPTSPPSCSTSRSPSSIRTSSGGSGASSRRSTSATS